VFEGIRGWWIYGACVVMLGVTRDGKGDWWPGVVNSSSTYVTC
jgi:hypothetical protein